MQRVPLPTLSLETLLPTEKPPAEPVFHLDEGKPRVDLLQFNALREVGKVAAFGAKKYGERNWEECADRWDWGKLIGSALRHTWAWITGEDNDPESGINHLAHGAWNVLTVLELVLAGRGKDNRMVLRKAVK